MSRKTTIAIVIAVGIAVALGLLFWSSRAMASEGTDTPTGPTGEDAENVEDEADS